MKVQVWRREHEHLPGLYRYKLYGNFQVDFSQFFYTDMKSMFLVNLKTICRQDVTVWEFLAVQLDLTKFRLSWDSNTVDCRQVAEEDQVGTHHLQICFWPTSIWNSILSVVLNLLIP